MNLQLCVSMKEEMSRSGHCCFIHLCFMRHLQLISKFSRSLDILLAALGRIVTGTPDANENAAEGVNVSSVVEEALVLLHSATENKDEEEEDNSGSRYVTRCLFVYGRSFEVYLQGNCVSVKQFVMFELDSHLPAIFQSAGHAATLGYVF